MATTLKQYFGNIRHACVSIFEGMAVTLSYCARKPVTVQYPDRIPKPVQDTLPPGYRGILEVDLSICIGCGSCEKRCPISVIEMEAERDAQSKQNYILRFDIDIAKCMFCGLCTEVCPTGAIRHSSEFEASTASIVNLTMRYVQPGEKVAAYKVVKGETPKGRPLNEAVRKVRKPWNAPAPLPPEAVRGGTRWKRQAGEEKTHE